MWLLWKSLCLVRCNVLARGPGICCLCRSIAKSSPPRARPLSGCVTLCRSTTMPGLVDIGDYLKNGVARDTNDGLGYKACPSEFELLDDTFTKISVEDHDHELSTAPILTRDAYVQADFDHSKTQYGVLGGIQSISSCGSSETPEDPRLYFNTNAPFSTVVCGVQGSGKSHTVSVMLENMFIASYPQIGSLEKELSGLVLHFGDGGMNSRPCEAAWLGVSGVPGVKPPPVRVFVAKSSLNTMQAIYRPLGGNISVQPLLFKQSDLDAEAFLSMMAVESSDSAPLYVQTILSILRDLGENFSVPAFNTKLEETKRKWNPAQTASFEQRMALMNTFTGSNKQVKGLGPLFAKGQLTIIDLSSPFIDPASACGIFEIAVRMFLRANVGTGKVLLVDEAHKYLSVNEGSSCLTSALSTLIREQRHLAMRVIISTQEPTVVPSVLLDLCTVMVLHRFSSPTWWEHIVKHVSADFSDRKVFDKIVRLRTGEAIVLAPTGLGTFVTPGCINPGPNSNPRSLDQFGRRYIVMKTRKRITADGGASVLTL
ncbi:hypothetical protein NEOLEDRAFT_1140300 [Neolentinus lepideus HHB14362 ss-1]|uniref:Zona occludens toxin N-terminal domain-containing protein n=1 Tax=Neolentinus lepideus HHB14362 ss-1 TaxID=1314782 RepID=A0A165PAU9_9AGAM|nr:hypothetical protein NEOLEDRAFT_1140300 [Neolentinus lepideus HHB14362 ss-1]